MAEIARTYTREYYLNGPSSYAEDYINSLPKRSTNPEIPEKSVPFRRYNSPAKEENKSNVSQTVKREISHGTLGISVMMSIVIGILLIGVIWFNAKATEIQYNINRINKEITVLKNDINMLNLEIEGSNSIEAVEAYARAELKMRSPKTNQCIYIQDEDVNLSGLVSEIKEKAY